MSVFLTLKTDLTSTNRQTNGDDSFTDVTELAHLGLCLSTAIDVHCQSITPMDSVWNDCNVRPSLLFSTSPTLRRSTVTTRSEFKVLLSTGVPFRDWRTRDLRIVKRDPTWSLLLSVLDRPTLLLFSNPNADLLLLRFSNGRHFILDHVSQHWSSWERLIDRFAFSLSPSFVRR